MKRAWGITIALVCALVWGTTALADKAVIDGKNAGKVHLREGRSKSSASLGLYFTGTPVLCESEPEGDWVAVTIGQETGYIKADYLLRGSEEGTAVTKKLGRVRVQRTTLRQKASSRSASLAELPRDTVLTLLGETKDRWYYVQTCGVYGYVSSDDVKGMKITFPFAEETHWFFRSGAGAWHTELVLQPDGAFSGVYEDTDAGDIGKKYPNGTHYYCCFFGQLRPEGSWDGQALKVSVTSLQWEDTPDEVRYVDGVREIASLPYGLSQGDRMMLCLTGVDEQQLTEEMRAWVRDNLSDGRVVRPVLLNLNEEYGFCMQ